MKHIIHRTATDNFGAWKVADVATRHGLRVVSITAPSKDWDFWGIFIEAPEDLDPDQLDKWVRQS